MSGWSIGSEVSGRSERNPDDPPGGVWETGAQPRLMLHHPPLVDLIDKGTANTAEIWLHENTQGVSTQLMGGTGMQPLPR